MLLVLCLDFFIMPKFYGRQRGFYRKRKQSAMQLARKALRKIPRPRLKFKHTQSIASTNNSWSVVLLNGIAVGDTASLRDGSTIAMDSFEFRVSWKTAAAVGAFGAVRQVVVYDRQPNGVSPVTSSIFVVNNSTTSPTLPTSDKRYIILYDQLFDLNEWAANSSVSSERTFTRKFSVRGLKSQYSADTGVIAAIQTGSLHYLHLSDRATNVPVHQFNGILRFHSTEN